MPNKGKNKGNTYERKIAKILSEAFDVKIDRTPCSGALRIKGDLCQLNTGNYDLPGVLNNFTIECKHQERLNIWECLKQTLREAEQEKREGMLIFHRNHDNDYVAVTLETMIKILKGKLK